MRKNSQPPTSDCPRPREKSMVYLNENAIKEAVQKTHKPQKAIEIEMIEQLKPHPFHHSRFNDLINNKCSHLRLHEGLALATVLNVFMSDFIKEDILKLGSFDIKLIKPQDIFKQQQCSHIISVQSSFPHYLLHKESLPYFQHDKTEFHQFFPLDNILNFLFSPISSLQYFQRINIIDNLCLLFEKSNAQNTLQFFTDNPYQLSNIQFFIDDALIYLDIPFSTNILAIKNKVLFNKMFNDFQLNIALTKVTTYQESLELLKRGKTVLENHRCITSHQIKQFYNDSSPHLKDLLPKINF